MLELEVFHAARDGTPEAQRRPPPTLRDQYMLCNANKRLPAHEVLQGSQFSEAKFTRIRTKICLESSFMFSLSLSLFVSFLEDCIYSAQWLGGAERKKKEKKKREKKKDGFTNNIKHLGK